MPTWVALWIEGHWTFLGLVLVPTCILGHMHVSIWLMGVEKGVSVVYRGASLVEQRLRVRLPIQGTQALALVWEDPTYHGAAKPMCHNCWAYTLEPMSHNYWACMPQLLKSVCLEPMLHNKRSHCNERPAHCKEGWPPFTTTGEGPRVAAKTQCS